ncbi:MAG: 6,7-dimethyl-8-ribityllumazine synthase [Gammaproteobacteria bacterium]|nr:6,7-dimethyl-8-ribityllumazine synthase [Gammaproteobacteria bacterium]
MTETKVYPGDLQGLNTRFGIVVGRFNSLITERLLTGASDTLHRHGVDRDNITVIWVPGAFEIPLAAKAMAETGKFEALVALGAIIRGATPHFDYVAAECSRGISRVSLEHGIPIGFGVLTVNSVEQANERAGTKSGNKGVDAATAALEMVNVLRELRALREIRE